MNSKLHEYIYHMDLQLKHVDAYGIRLAYFESREVSHGETTLLLVHGMGCHARCWDESLKILDSPCHTICVELRGHGRSEKQGPYRWDHFGKDLCSFIQLLNLKAIVGVGHSLGGHVLLQAASVFSRRFESILLLEPVVFDPVAYSDAAFTKEYDSAEEHPFAKRRMLWNSPQEWMNFLKDRNPYKLWDSAVLRDHCRFGLEQTADGQFKLCCPPIVEAETTIHFARTSVYPLLPSVNVPATVVRAKSVTGIRHPSDTLHSLTWPRLAEYLPHGRDKYFEEVSHFIPMQRPDIVASELRAHLSGHSDA